MHWRLHIGTAVLLAGFATAAIASSNTPTVADAKRIDARDLPFVRQTDERFQSFQIGFSHLTGGETWKAYDALPKGEVAKDFASVREKRAATDLSNPKLHRLTAALSPFYVRFSGTTANSVYFHDADTPLPAKVPEGFTVMLTRERWKEALRFAKANNLKIVTSFANSEGVRDASHGWTPRMAASWLAYTRKAGGSIFAAELFNEPNAPEPPRIPRGLTAEEFGRDYAAWSTFMAKAAPAIRRAGPGNAMMGVPGIPSIGTPPEAYAGASPKPEFQIYSYHFYPALAQRCAPESSPLGMSADKALSEDWLARPEKEFLRQKAVRDKYAPGAPIWLTETGGAACGGLRWQPTFLDMFRFLDTQARLAKAGLDAMFTHALISGSNGIIDEKTLEPNASYWGAVLWRRLMGSRILDTGLQAAGLHTYAHCLRGKSGGVALLAINLKDSVEALAVPGQAQVYALTASELQTRTVLLSGKELKLDAGGRLPAMLPVAAKGGQVELAPHSISFIALPSAGNASCRGSLR